jgi:hypothetical protein
MKITVEDRWMGDGTAYIWHAQEDKLLFRGITGSLPEAIRDAGNAIQRSRGWPGLVSLTLAAVEGEEGADPDPVI